MRHASRSEADNHLNPGGSKPQHSWLLVLAGCGLLAAQAAVAGEPSNISQVGAPPVAKPRVSGNLLVPVRHQLSLGFFLAQTRIRTHPTCSALFGRFGADGADLLAKLRFDGATFEGSSNACGRGGVPAYTKVGSHLISLCPGFGVLSIAGAAQTVIHEALHSAGMSEKPVDPEGLTPQEINRMVKVSCGF